MNGPSILCLLVPALSGCSSVMLAGGPGYDAGTLGVPGIETGIGGQIEVIRYPRAGDAGAGLGAALELAGHSTANDADPLAFTTFDLRYRRPFDAAAARSPYWEVGSGVGIAWSAGIQAAALPVQAEFGVQRRAGSLLLSVGARERFIGLVGTGSPRWDALNSLQLVFGARFGAGTSQNGQRRLLEPRRPSPVWQRSSPRPPERRRHLPNGNLKLPPLAIKNARAGRPLAASSPPAGCVRRTVLFACIAACAFDIWRTPHDNAAEDRRRNTDGPEQEPGW